MRLPHLAVFAAVAAWVYVALVAARLIWTAYSPAHTTIPSWGSLTLSQAELAAIPIALTLSLVAHTARVPREPLPVDRTEPTRRPWWRTLLRGLLITTVSGYALCLLVFAVFQRSLLYFPERHSADEARARATAGELEPVASREGDVLGWLARHPLGGEATLIVAHGNAGSALDRTYFVELARARRTRFDVLLVEYPGYGARRGTPSETTNVAAVVEAIDGVRGNRPIVLVGESLGSAVVALAAAKRPREVKGLVLITPLPRTALAARHHYPFIPSFLILDRYEADDAIARWNGPVAFVVASEDEVIPAGLGLAMHHGYRGPKRLWVDQGATHNGIHYGAALPRWDEVFDFVMR